jgi:Lhr-like helicase
MNALANSQCIELEKFLCHGYSDGTCPVTFARYTGQESTERRKEIIGNPPDILLTNYVMLELILTRPHDLDLSKSANNLQFLVLDEMHTYRGRQGADVAMLVRTVKDVCSSSTVQCVGTSATVAGAGSWDEVQEEVSKISTLLFGSEVKKECIIGETLKRTTEDRDINAPDFIHDLCLFVKNSHQNISADYDEFIRNPLFTWIESTFGLKKGENGNLKEVNPEYYRREVE